MKPHPQEKFLQVSWPPLGLAFAEAQGGVVRSGGGVTILIKVCQRKEGMDTEEGTNSSH